MTIISGESGSGKSELAVKFANNLKNSLYLTLDKDFKTIKKLKELKIDYTNMSFKSLLDIKYRILERGGLMFNDLDYVIIDSLNLITDQKTYLEKVNYLLEVEKDFKLKIICTLNKPMKFDSLIKGGDNINLIELKKLIKLFK